MNKQVGHGYEKLSDTSVNIAANLVRHVSDTSRQLLQTSRGLRDQSLDLYESLKQRAIDYVTDSKENYKKFQHLKNSFEQIELISNRHAIIEQNIRTKEDELMLLSDIINQVDRGIYKQHGGDPNYDAILEKFLPDYKQLDKMGDELHEKTYKMLSDKNVKIEDYASKVRNLHTQLINMQKLLDTCTQEAISTMRLLSEVEAQIDRIKQKYRSKIRQLQHESRVMEKVVGDTTKIAEAVAESTT